VLRLVLVSKVFFRTNSKPGTRNQQESGLREIRVLLADDYEPWRRFVSSLLLQYSGLQIIGEVSDGLNAVMKAVELKPDLVLLDISLPRLNGVEAASRIREAAPTTKIVFISAYQDSEALRTVLSDGAEGYILKWEIGTELLPAMEAALRGRKFVTAQLTDLT
jgi:two-component system response regulator NreC